MTEAVNHPHHYTSHPSGVEAIEICRHLTGDWFNVFKCIFRADLKNGRQDIEKALWYADDAVEHDFPVRAPSWTPYQTALLMGIMDYETGVRYLFFAAILDQQTGRARSLIAEILEEYGDE